MPTALSVANNEGAEVVGGTASALPVFYDRTGRRPRYVVAVLCVVVLALGGSLGACVPRVLGGEPRGDGGAFAAVRHSPDLPPGVTMLPVVGVDDGILTRVVKVVPTDPAPCWDDRDQGWFAPSCRQADLVDPFTGKLYRHATDDEVRGIGDSTYAVDHYGRPADHTLMITFDDGPDPTFTPMVLDVLGREHVPATFFVIGGSVVKNPDIVRRAIREGHLIGNHTLTHPASFDQHGDFRDREEIQLADRLIRGATGYRTRVFRIPEGDPDRNPLAGLHAQQLGYVHVNEDLDTRDWSVNGAEVPVPPLDGRGHVVLMHDGGGDRAATVRALQRLITEAKRQGYTFSTVAPLLDPADVPAKDAGRPPLDLLTYEVWRLVLVGPGVLLGFLFWLGVGSLSTMTVLYLTLALLLHRERRRSCEVPDAQLPRVSVVLAAYNEEKVIRRTISQLRRCDYPRERLEVVAVNDGSADGTLQILRECEREWPQLRVVDQPNSGKSSAINNGINHAESQVIVTMDADTLLRAQTIRMLARHFVLTRHGSKPVGAVAGHVKVGNRRNILTAWQSLEYISGICVTRMAEARINAISIVPGACSAWSREALERIGGFCEQTMAEDADATLSLQRLGYRIVQENSAIGDTEAPETIRALVKQRKRWTYGNIQAMWKHKDMLFRPKYGLLGMVSLPYALLSLMVPLLFLPLAVIAAVTSLAAGNWHSIALFGAFVTGLHLIVSVVAIWVARERPWHLLVVPVYRLIYEPLRAYLLYASVYRVVRGTVVRWDKLERRNSVRVAADAENERASIWWNLPSTQQDKLSPAVTPSSAAICR